VPDVASDYTPPEAPEERRRLAQELAFDDDCGRPFADAMRLLTLLSQDPDLDVRRLAIQSLETRCNYRELEAQEIEETVYPIVRKGFESETPELQLACLSLLRAAESGRHSGRYGERRSVRADVKWAIPNLIEFIVEDGESFRSIAVDVFWSLDRDDLQVGATLPGRADPLTSLSAQIRCLFSDLSPNRNDTGAIRRFLERRERELKRLGLVAASWIGTLLVDEVTVLLEDPETVVRLDAIAALERMGPETSPVLVGLLENLARRIPADQGAGMCSEPARTAGPGRHPPCSDEIARVYMRALEAIGRMGRRARVALPAVKDALRQRHTGIRLAAVKAWSQIASSAGDILPDIIPLVDDHVGQVADAAVAVVRWILHWAGDCPHDLGGAIVVLDKAIKQASPDSRVYDFLPLYVVQVVNRDDLARLLPLALETTALALSSTSADALRSGLLAANELGTGGGKLVPAVLAIIERTIKRELPSEDPGLARMAFRALGNIRVGVAHFIPRLVGLLESSDANIRWGASVTLTSIDPDQRDALSFLHRMRDSTIEEDRIEATNRLKYLARHEHQ